MLHALQNRKGPPVYNGPWRYHDCLWQSQDSAVPDSAAEDCYDEENEQFNSELEELKDEFESLDIEGLKETVSEDGALYNLATFDGHDKFDEIMQSKYAYLAIDDMTDYYSEKALQEVSEMYDDVHRTFFDQGDEFLEGMDYILKALKVAIDFTERWKASRINPDIDNT